MIDEFEIFEDTKCWMGFEGESEDETLWVYCRCPECGRYLKRGECWINLNGDFKLKKFICKKHGEVDPFSIVN